MSTSRRDFLSAAGAASLAAAFGSARAGEQSNRRPNFIVVMADDCSAREFGCYEHPEHRTPHIDRMAREGVMFDTCWCTPICSPTRAQMMTGKYGFRTKWFHNDLKDASTPLSDGHLIFSQMLQQQDYATAICGKWQLPGTYEEYGFDEHCMWEAGGRSPFPGFDGPIEQWDDARGRVPSGLVPRRAARYWHPQVSLNGKHFKTTADDYGPDIFVDFLLDFAKRKRDEPFFVYYPMALTHKSWDFDRNVAGWLPTPKLDAQGNRVPGQSEPGLKSNVEYMDYLMGRIERELTELGLMENTVLFITGDNGTSGYGKGQVREERGPRVPLVVYGPGHVEGIGASDALTSHCDIFATMRDLSGASLPAGYPLDGHSFAPLLSGQPFEEREWIFSYYKFERMLRDKRWLLDGYGKFFDCGSRRNEQGYLDVTDSKDPEVVAAKGRFATILAALPAPDPNDPIVVAYRAKMGKGEGSLRLILPEVTTLAVGSEPVRIECRDFVTLEPDATVDLSRDEGSLLVAFDVQNEDAASLKREHTQWGECDGVELSIYGGGFGNLILHVYPDGTIESHRNTDGELQPLSLPAGGATVQTSLTATGWTAEIRLTRDLFGGNLPDTIKFNAGGYRTGARTGWFAWINQGRENFRPKNQGVLQLR